ncbi:MAG: type II secretion system F family protein [Lachnospiraceae bacterium]|nr:type II secretion system F family protein [Lachnospiraceae bacterium]
MRELKETDIRSLAESMGIIVLLALFFYRSFLAAVFLLPLLFPILKRRKRIREQKRRRQLTVSFREVMNSLTASLKAGYSAENAFRDAYSDMVMLFGRTSPIAQELYRINTGLDANIPVERLLTSFAERTKVEEITEFAEVFSIAKRSGGNMAGILERTSGLIRSRLETEEEIGVMISAKKMEQKIMDVVPFGIVVYIGATSRGFFDTLYHNPAGIAVMTACMCVYLAAFAMSEKIVEIRI